MPRGNECVAAAVSCREGHVNARRAFCPEFAPHPAVHVATERQDTGVTTKANSEADLHFISCEYLWDKGRADGCDENWRLLEMPIQFLPAKAA